MNDDFNEENKNTNENEPISNGERPIDNSNKDYTKEYYETKTDFIDTKEVVHEDKKNKKDKNNKNKLIKFVSICFISVIGVGMLGLGIGVGSVVARNYFYDGMNSTTSTQTTSEIIPTTESQNYSYESTESVSEIVAQVSPSVVDIVSTTNTSTDIFSKTVELPTAVGSGSGVIFEQDDQNIYIVTNYHVIAGANDVKVTIQGSEPIPAHLVGSNPMADLAVIKVSNEEAAAAGVENVTVATFGNSDEVQVGEEVLAIGNALGEGDTVTQGIVSAKNKTITVEGRELEVIQTDAAINPGHSGGPLVNMQGEVIGINTAKTASSVGEGMGYSIPSNIVVEEIDNIMKNQSTTAFLGVKGSDVNQQIADMYNIPEMGVYVNTVVPGSAADQAGIERGDIITSFNGKPVYSMEDLSDKISKCEVGETVTIKLLREDEVIEVTAKLQEQTTTKF